MHLMKALLFAFSLVYVRAQTPVIGGSCKVGTADVQIGGKQTQFFLKCEATSESADGEGVWVVKSRAAASPATPTTSQLPPENTQPQQHPKIMRKHNNPNICEQDNGAREADSCTVSATCLQANLDQPTTFLQCEQSGQRWVKKSCQEGYIFNFEQQACIVPKRLHSLSRQQAAGLVCTFSSCSNSNPCNSGTCNNGYCCSSGSNSNSQTQYILASPQTNNCVGCGAAAAPQIITIPAQSSCPGGGMSYGTCSSGYCATGYQCVQGSCCPSYQQPQPSISVYTCPGGGNSVGSCNSGTCATGYSCSSQNTCCPTTNPFVCPDGTQAAGGCVNGQCGSGYSCSNGLCCAATSSSPKCLDGSPAVGACIPSCTGDSCGRMSLTYYCGAGYTCTTGNICCPVNSCPDGGEPIGPTVNGLCPTGYSAQGTQCCSIVNTCLDGETSIGEPINGLCPTGYTLRGNACCGGGASAIFAAACIAEVQLGPCINSVVGDTCGGRNGYACNTGATGAATGELTCCPTVDYTTDANIIGPAILSPDGVTYECPIDYTAVMVNGEMQCVALASTPGVCDTAVQSGPCIGDTCPGGDVCNVYAQVCCPATTMSRLRNTRPKQPSQSIFSSRPRQSALTANKAIGSPCTGSQQCAGFTEGLSKCEQRVCRCTSIAYAKGIACVRRKMLLMNDQPMPVESSADSNSILPSS